MPQIQDIGETIGSDKISDHFVSEKISYSNSGDNSDAILLHRKCCNKSSFYKIYVNTGDQCGAETSSSIYLSLVGESAYSEPQILKNRNKQFPETFPRGMTKSLYIKTCRLNQLKYIAIKFVPKDKTDTWFLKDIRIEEIMTKCKWYVKCFKWFSEKENFQTLTALKFSGDITRKINYEIRLYVSDTNPGGFQLPLYVKLYGSLKKSYRILLLNTILVTNREPYLFLVGTGNVGNVTRIRIGIIETEKNSNFKLYESAILIRRITIESYEDHSTKFSSINKKWIKPSFYKFKSNLDLTCSNQDNDLGLLDLNIRKHPSRETIFYDIMIWNSNSQFLNESSLIFIQFIGQTKVWSPIYEISYKNHCIDDKLNRRKVVGENVGSISKIKIWHNKAGIASGWHLEKVKIVRQLSNREIYMTISGMKHQGKLQCGIDTKDGRIIITPLDLQKDANGSIIHLEEAGDDINAILQKNDYPKENFVIFPYAEESTFLCHTWLNLDGNFTIQKVLSVKEKKIINSAIKITHA